MSQDKKFIDQIKSDIEPGNAGLYSKRAAFYSFNLDDDNAVKNFTKAIELEPEYAKDYLEIMAIDCVVNFILKTEAFLGLKKLNFYNDNRDYLKLAAFLNELCFSEDNIPVDIKEFIFRIFSNYPDFKDSLSEVLERDGEKLFLIRSKLSILADIFCQFNKEISKKEKTEELFYQQAEFAFSYFVIDKYLQQKHIELIEKKEENKAQIRLDERNKVIQDFSHHIKNLISTIIDPLENLKLENDIKPRVIENALKGANLIREVVNTMSLSFKGTIDDFYYDAKYNTRKNSLDLRAILIESLKYSAGNMFDGKYFNNSMIEYFPTKEIYLEAKAEWTKVSQLGYSDIQSFLQKYFFETDITFGNAGNFVIGNEKGSAIKLLIMFQEIILNAFKNGAFVDKKERFLGIRFAENRDQIFIKIENSCETRTITVMPAELGKIEIKVVTKGIGHVIINNFASLLNTKPIIKVEEGSYSVEIRFADFWKEQNK
ncbi:hypothetical protein QUF80_01170 [Desulfococcaceae bacterium HSG8]|nr:hypothetical protein [Desulfococcaceae bacterium HSG8]